MSNDKEPNQMLRKSDEYNKLFWILYDTKDGITAKDLIELHGFNKRVYERLKKLEEAGITKDISTHKETFKYILKPEFREKTVNHLRFFEKLLEKEGSVLFGDAGELSHKNPFARRYMNNHSLVGFPKVYDEKNDKFNYTHLEHNILDCLLQQIDDTFDYLKELKLVMELRKKVENEKWLNDYEFPYGIISEKLILNNIIFWFSKVLYELLEQDLHKSRSFDFIFDLCQETMKLSKKHKLWLSDGAYPEKSFTWNNPFIFELLMASKPDLAFEKWDKNGKIFPATQESFDLIKNENWIFNKKNILSLEKIEETVRKDAEKQLIKGTNEDVYNDIATSKMMERYSPLQPLYEYQTGKPFYPSELDLKESIALLSTQSIIESTEYKKNVDLRLNHHFSNYSSFKDEKNPKDIKHNSGKIADMTWVILEFKSLDSISINKIRVHKDLNKYYTKDEIEIMIMVGKHRGKSWLQWQECQDYILYKIYDKNGPWYNKFFYNWAGEIINKKYSNEKELLLEIHKYCKRPPLKNKGGIFEDYVKARYYFEKEKPILDEEKRNRKKSKKFKYKLEVRNFADLFEGDF
jgi:hypothetical protein